MFMSTLSPTSLPRCTHPATRNTEYLLLIAMPMVLFPAGALRELKSTQSIPAYCLRLQRFLAREKS